MKNIEWIFFDIGSTLVDETKAYEHRLKDAIAGTDISYEQAYKKVVEIAKRNNAEPIKALGLPLTPWHSEDEFVYPQSKKCLMTLHKKYKIGIIANQALGTAERLKKYG
ncbi:MAG: HAD family hydrolase, partial [Candidatus Ornithomonoglobus sp.]